jgi:hypothetical protein
MSSFVLVFLQYTKPLVISQKKTKPLMIDRFLDDDFQNGQAKYGLEYCVPS